MNNTSTASKNRYQIDFVYKNKNYNGYLSKVSIQKNPLVSETVEDQYIFSHEALPLVNLVGEKIQIKISIIDPNDTAITIYKGTHIIDSATVLKNGAVVVWVDRDRKKEWINNQYFSMVHDNKTVKEALEDYIKELDAWTKRSSSPTNIFFNLTTNINKFKYEKILFPISTPISAVDKCVKDYKLMNVPTYFFLDEYYFDFDDNAKQHDFFSLEFYDFTAPKKLRAVDKEKMNIYIPFTKSKVLPFASKSLIEKYEDNKYFINKMHDYYVKRLKPDPTNPVSIRSKLAVDGDKEIINRIKETAAFFKKYKHVIKYYINDFDVRQRLLGYRLTVDDSDTQIQYQPAVVGVDYLFTRSTVNSENKLITFVASATISCLN